MKLIQELAFKASDDYCKCGPGEPCLANAYKDGYEAGFREAREMAAKEAEELANPNSLVDDGFGEFIAEQVRKLGEEEV